VADKKPSSVSSTNDGFQFVYETTRSKSDSREHRLRCLEIAARSGASDAEHIVRAAKRYWLFVRKGD
jgi:hypothetical protein